MPTYIMFGKYTGEAVKGASKDRTAKAAELARKYGGQIKAVYALLGETDLLVVADFPGNAEATKTSVALSRMTGIRFATSPAMSVEEFDNLIGEL